MRGVMDALFFLAFYLVPGVLLGLLQLLATKSITKWGALIVSIVPSLLLLFFANAALIKGKEEDEISMRGETSTDDGWVLLIWFFVNLPFLIASIRITLGKAERQQDD
jgi:hypothetical protein